MWPFTAHYGRRRPKRAVNGRSENATDISVSRLQYWQFAPPPLLEMEPLPLITDADEGIKYSDKKTVHDALTYKYVRPLNIRPEMYTGHVASCPL